MWPLCSQHSIASRSPIWPLCVLSLTTCDDLALPTQTCQLDVLSVLLEAGAAVEARSHSGWTPLVYANARLEKVNQGNLGRPGAPSRAQVQVATSRCESSLDVLRRAGARTDALARHTASVESRARADSASAAGGLHQTSLLLLITCAVVLLSALLVCDLVALRWCCLRRMLPMITARVGTSAMDVRSPSLARGRAGHQQPGQQPGQHNKARRAQPIRHKAKPSVTVKPPAVKPPAAKPPAAKPPAAKPPEAKPPAAKPPAGEAPEMAASTTTAWVAPVVEPSLMAAPEAAPLVAAPEPGVCESDFNCYSSASLQLAGMCSCDTRSECGASGASDLADLTDVDCASTSGESAADSADESSPSGHVGLDDEGSDAERSTCVVCLEAPQDAGIVHGGSVHLCCCQACASVLHARGLPCPMCRTPIEMVLKAFRA